MNESTTDAIQADITTATAEREAVQPTDYPAYIGLDVHTDTRPISVARSGRAAPDSWGEIANKPKKIAQLVERLAAAFGGEVLAFQNLPGQRWQPLLRGRSLSWTTKV